MAEEKADLEANNNRKNKLQTRDFQEDKSNGITTGREGKSNSRK